jgi:hypothetical protein
VSRGGRRRRGGGRGSGRGRRGTRRSSTAGKSARDGYKPNNGAAEAAAHHAASVCAHCDAPVASALRIGQTVARCHALMKPEFPTASGAGAPTLEVDVSTRVADCFAPGARIRARRSGSRSDSPSHSSATAQWREQLDGPAMGASRHAHAWDLTLLSLLWECAFVFPLADSGSPSRS